MVNILDADFWNSRYLNQDTGWDLGMVSPPLKAYSDQIENKNIAILIPGAGNAYEAIYLIQNGFTNVTVVDFASAPLEQLKEKLANVNEHHYHLIKDDFFNHKGQYDLMIEQTFFCAINPNKRPDYVQHAHQLLKPKGKIVGLLFNRIFPFEGPPFGGEKSEYLNLFDSKFAIELMDEAYNSVAPRQGSELFIKLIKN
ncbi:TPMT family class I SAM-dependent methyltransferase [Pelobium sp.]|nr:methyltransferase [Pelobium sp.]MDA9555084.1 TPMT family class I SAM-dependent methyltransferase [Pelobium sp.]